VAGFLLLISLIFTLSKDCIELYGFENDFIEDLMDREFCLRLKVLLLFENFGSLTTDVYLRCVLLTG
jgi:hypothetical protein